MRIALVKMSSMGDVIHTLPVVSDIRKALPQARIDWIVEQPFAPLAALHPDVNQILPVALRRWRRELGRAESRAQYRQLRQQLAEREYDLILDLQGLLKSAWVSRWPKGRRAGFKWACAREPLASLSYHQRYGVDMSAHAIERLRELAQQALHYQRDGLPVFNLVAPAPSAQLTQVLQGAHEQFGRPDYRVFLHATSRAEKLWPAEHWHQLLLQAKNQRLPVLLPWGNPAEKRAAQALHEQTGHGTVLPALDLSECASLLAGAQAVVGVDTGLMHLSAALDTPTVALFAATPAWRYGPYWSKKSISMGENGVWPGPDAVAAAVSSLLHPH